MSDIFISYAREDRKTVQHLAAALQARGWSVWWDTRLKAGEEWDKVIERELDAARCVVVLWSDASVQSHWVRIEAREGLRRRVLVPARIETVEPPPEFQQVHTEDLSDWNGTLTHPGFEQLMAAIIDGLRAPWWKRILQARSPLVFLTAILLALIVASWNRPVRDIFLPRVFTLPHAAKELPYEFGVPPEREIFPNVTSPPPVVSSPRDVINPLLGTLPVNLSLKFHGHRRNDTAVRLDEQLSRRFKIDTAIRIVPNPHDEEDRLSMLIRMFNEESDAFDVVMIDMIWIHDLATHLVDLNLFFNEGEIISHNKKFIGNNRVAERLVALPWFENRGLLFYRQDLLDKYRQDLKDKHRWDVPRTWQDLAEAAEIIQKKQIEENNSQFIGFAWQGKRYEGLTCNALEWFASEGALIENTGLPDFDHSGVLDALDRARGWVKGDNPISPHVRDHSEGESLQRFIDGKAAFHRGWSNEYVMIKQAGIEFGVAPLPRGKAGKSFSVLGGWQLAVPKYSRNQASAIEFVRYLSSPAVQRWRAKEGGYQPTIEAVAKERYVKEALPFLEEEWFEDVKLIVRPSNRFYSKVSECIYNSVDSALNRNLRSEIVQDIKTMKNCVDGASNGAISDGAVDE